LKTYTKAFRLSWFEWSLFGLSSWSQQRISWSDFTYVDMWFKTENWWDYFSSLGIRKILL